MSPARLLFLVALVLLAPIGASAQWSAQPGDTVRNAFGPMPGTLPSMCRGACGKACPESCSQSVTFECLDSERARRVVSYTCGTHRGCREHDDCLDACRMNADGLDCDTYCHTQAIETWGIERASSWSMGSGPFDGDPIRFEYTLHAPNSHEPAFRCPEGARLSCSSGLGRCLTAGGAAVEPVFDSYPTAGPDAMQVAAFRAGALCGERVCNQATTIRVDGQDTCERGRCTRYGVEFDYRNADPAVPLECSASTTGGGDFVGNLLKGAADAMPQQGQGPEADGMAQLMGLFQQVLKSADTSEDAQISMTPLDEAGNPIESQRVGPGTDFVPSVPRSIPLPAASGRLVVPMYQLVDIGDTSDRVREIRCTHKGWPVFEVAFQLQF
ncbi:hypothetical protein [Thioalkalivibrio sp. XN8]|uniref:hypothetical protein n=1 Tax=Thioalkalivibrio sp. XN8 TaxID=2712863 RepID=UPI0013EA3928|nr:hypothetical protein [Thioalkalivibrio sp. XN8]NGP54451.1 hypothetical protein [Thioalkalivibrio sp. XN8]